jgi:hypothetical protein
VDRTTKHQSLLFLILTAAVSIIIAAGLPQLSLEPGMPLPEFPPSTHPFEVQSFFAMLSLIMVQGLMTLFKFLTAVFFLFSLYMIYKYISGEKHIEWKSFRFPFIKILIGISIIIGLILIAYYFFSLPSNPFANDIQTRPLRQKSVYMPVESILGVMLWVLIFICAGLAVLIAFRVFTLRQTSHRTSRLIELEAKKAKADLESGRDLKDIITRCYLQMSIALKREQGIERTDSMTTGEFEYLLNAAGAPAESVRELTRLFEAVRYGNLKSKPGDEKKAIRCFDEIITHFSRKKGNTDHEKQ